MTTIVAYTRSDRHGRILVRKAGSIAAGLAVATAAVIALPLLFSSPASVTILCLAGIMIVFSLSYNVLLGQTGLLSFGHAVYYGVGAFGTVYAMNAVIGSTLPVPVLLVPLAGGLASICVAAILGWISTKRGGTVFAMISLGVAELFASSASVLQGLFGSEEGIATDRSKLYPLFELTFAPQIEVYFLIAFWCLVSAAALYAISQTPFGRMCNAVRENEERVEFVGCNPNVVRYLAFCISAFFAGVAGGLAVINFEVANSTYFGSSLSAIVLLATFLGGTNYFLGPVVGATIVTLLQAKLSDVTEIWQLYFGLMFLVAVTYARSGVAGILAAHVTAIKKGLWRRVWPSYLFTILSAAMVGLGLVALLEPSARNQIALSLHRIGVDPGATWLSVVAIAWGAFGFVSFRTSLRNLVTVYNAEAAID